MKSASLLCVFIFRFIFSFSQRYHIRPLNIQDCNKYEVIFIGQIVGYELFDDEIAISFKVKENLKLRNNDCYLTLKTRRPIPEEFDGLNEESWLIFGELWNEDLYIDIWQSTRLNNFKTYPEKLMQQDLQYLRGLTSYSHKIIKETYQQSAKGCIPNDKYYIAEGALVNAYPHGQWKYYSSEGIVQSEGFYYKGTKWGEMV